MTSGNKIQKNAFLAFLYCKTILKEVPKTVMNTVKAFVNFKNKRKNIGSNVLWYVKVYIFWKFIKYSIHWDKLQMQQQFS